MISLQQRSFEDGIGHHQRDPVRVYEEDPVQSDRIDRARIVLSNIVGRIRADEERTARILELGCGTGDISGPFSEGHTVRGIDCAGQQIEKARERFPRGEWLLGPAEYFASGYWDVVVMCEFLEHIAEPEKMVKQRLLEAEYSIISHPLNEHPDSQLSGGDHQWSYNEEDFRCWFSIGGHQLQRSEVFQMGAYNVILGWGRNDRKKEKGE